MIYTHGEILAMLARLQAIHIQLETIRPHIDREDRDLVIDSARSDIKKAMRTLESLLARY